jgi:hypothetical protein
MRWLRHGDPEWGTLSPPTPQEVAEEMHDALDRLRREATG